MYTSDQCTRARARIHACTHTNARTHVQSFMTTYAVERKFVGHGDMAMKAAARACDADPSWTPADGQVRVRACVCVCVACARAHVLYMQPHSWHTLTCARANTQRCEAPPPRTSSNLTIDLYAPRGVSLAQHVGARSSLRAMKGSKPLHMAHDFLDDLEPRRRLAFFCLAGAVDLPGQDAVPLAGAYVTTDRAGGGSA